MNKTPKDYMRFAEDCVNSIAGSTAPLETTQKLCEQAKTIAALAVAQAQIEAAEAQREYWHQLVRKTRKDRFSRF